jgi:hypothetical protein
MANPKRYAEKLKRKGDEKESHFNVPGNSSIIKPLFEPHFKSIFAKMEISQPGDDLEIQADEIADSFMHGQAEESREILSQPVSEISRQSDGQAIQTPDGFDQQLQSTKGQGQQLDEGIKSELEEHTGTDLNHVNIHTDTQAHDMSAGINAKAFAHGDDIYFKQGNYNPQSEKGKELLAHEVAHVVQQGTGLHDKLHRKKDPKDTSSGDTPTDGGKERTIQVGFYLSKSVEANDPTGFAHVEYLKQVYGKSPEEAQSISDTRGTNGRWRNFPSQTVSNKPLYVVINVTPKRYLQNLYGDEILSKDTSLLESYLTGSVTSDTNPVLVPITIQHPDYTANNAYLATIKDVIGINALYKLYKDLFQVYYNSFENMDFEIEKIKSENSIQITQIKQNQKTATLSDPPIISPGPIAQTEEAKRQEKIQSNNKLYPELTFLIGPGNEMLKSDYKFSYNGNLPTNPPSYEYLVAKTVELNSLDYSEEIITMLKKELLKKVENEYVTTSSNAKSAENYIKDLETIISQQKKSMEYQKLQTQKQGLDEFNRIANSYLNALPDYRNFIQSNDQAYWSTQLERVDFEAPITWQKFLAPAQNQEPFAAFHLKYTNINIDAVGYLKLQKDIPDGLSDEDVIDILKGGEEIRAIVNYIGLLEKGIGNAKKLLNVPLTGGTSTAIPLNAVIVANNIGFPLKLYLQLNGKTWSFVDLTSVAEPTVYEGGTVKNSNNINENQAAISSAWLKFLHKNTLRSGKIVIEKPAVYFPSETDPMWRSDNISENMSEEMESINIGGFFPKYKSTGKITAKITPDGATAMANRMLNGDSGFDPAYSPKNGGSMFFVSQGNPYTGKNPEQTIEVEVSVKVPNDVLVFNDADLFEIQSELMIDVFEQNDAKIRQDPSLILKFKNAFKNYNNRPYREKNFTLDASEMGISKTKRDNLLRNERGNAENAMWTKVGERVKGYTSGFGKVIMGDNAPSPYSTNAGEFLVVSESAKVKIIGGDQTFADAIANAGAETSSPEALDVMRNAKIGRVKAVFRVGGRLLLLYAIAQDTYSFFYAKDKLREITRIAGGWTGAWIAGGAFAAYFAPADTAGPWAWVAHGLGTMIASGIGYTVGSEMTTWVYDLQIEDDDDGIKKY